MKLKTWNNLKVGDVVTVRTVEEMTSLKDVYVDGDGDLILPDEKTARGAFITGRKYTDYMNDYCGKSYVITEVNQNDVRLDSSGWHWCFTRKMLRDEVVKHED